MERQKRADRERNKYERERGGTERERELENFILQEL